MANSSMVDSEEEVRLLKAVFDAAIDVILTIDGQGTVRTANPAIEHMFGYLPEEIVGQNVRILMPAPYHDEHDRYLTNYQETGERKIIGIGREVEGKRKDGSTFSIDLAVSETQTDEGPIYIGVLRDITERKRAAEQIRRERALLKAVVETAIDGIITIDGKGTILSANPAIEEIFGYAPSDLIGQNVRALMPAPYHGEHDRYLENYRQSGVKKIIGIGRQVHGRRKDGTTFPIELAVSETQVEDGVIFTGIVRDVSERMNAMSDLQAARDEALLANSAKSEFLSRMSHELRTPLNAVLGFAQLLDMRYDDPKIQQATRSILKAGQHLLNLINEVLDLSRIEAGRLTISIEPVLLAQIIVQAMDIVQPIAEKNGVQIRVHAESCSESHVLADRQRLLQVFINLLSNAVKFNRPQGTVDVFCEPNGPNHRVLIHDTGIGILEEHRERLFQPFERLGGNSVEGTGLGLVLSRRFVELMRGSLHLLESSSNGSVFCVDLTAASMGDMKAINDLAASGRKLDALSLKGTILYIEDNLSNMKLVEMLLESWPNIELVPAMQGNVGIELAISHLPDLIFLDLHLPDLPGVDVLRHLKADPRTAKIPVVVVSADATSGQIRRIRQAGAYDYLTKPLDIGRFVQVVEAFLDSEARDDADLD